MYQVSKMGFTPTLDKEPKKRWNHMDFQRFKYHLVNRITFPSVPLLLQQSPHSSFPYLRLLRNERTEQP